VDASRGTRRSLGSLPDFSTYVIHIARTFLAEAPSRRSSLAWLKIRCDEPLYLKL
jgi:hypothetical protein